MADSTKQGQPPLVDRVLQCGKLAYDPDLPAETRAQGQHDFKALIERYGLFKNSKYNAKVSQY
jgi:hypothetical protein